MTAEKLSARQLTVATTSEDIPAMRSDELQPAAPCDAQPRASAALRRALAMPGRGFHVLALGIEGVGRRACIAAVLQQSKASATGTDDRCLVPVRGQTNRYEELALPASRGEMFVEAVRQLITATILGDTDACERSMSQLRSGFADQAVVQRFTDWLEETSSPLVSGQHNDFEYLALQRLMPYQLVVGQEQAPYVTEAFPEPASLLGSCSIDPDSGRRQINAGSLLRASGGCLVIDARPLVENVSNWRLLREVLKTGYIELNALPSLPAAQGATGFSLEGRVALSCKVVLLCDGALLERLQLMDPDLVDIFPVVAEFEYELPRNRENLQQVSRILATLITRHGCLPFSASGLAAMLDVASMMTGSQDHLSLYRTGLSAVLREASASVAEEGRLLVEGQDVRLAVSALEQRVQVAERESRRAILRHETRVELAGTTVGQVNGLTIVGNGIQSYLEPARITARVRAGEGNIIDIEREVDLGGAIHSKGVLILAGLLGARYAPHVPLSLIVSLVFEQSYADIDGDSASAAEMLALLSAIADLPLRQSLAITGAIDQRGQILCVGDVSMKINGFFRLCRDYGLDGSHGVVIPSANVHDLILHDEVIEAVDRGLFRVYAVEHIDDAIELFGDLPAGAETGPGEFSAGSFNHQVVKRLIQYAQERKDFEHRDE